MTLTTSASAPSATDPSGPIEVVAQAGLIGAEIRGVDLSGPIDDDRVGAIRAALLRWKVVFFRDQHIGPHEQIAFGRRFAEVTPAHPTLPSLEGHPEVLKLSTEGYAAESPGGEDEPGRLIENRWHTDVTFLPTPPLGSILRAVTVPHHGGDTGWSNLVGVYESLSPSIRRFIDELQAVHHNEIHVELGSERGQALRRQFTSTAFATVHPVVRVHPETGERALFVNPQFTSHIVGLSNRESRRVLELLYEAIGDPRFTVRFHWEPGSIAFWDNRATAHLASFDYVPPATRTMHRITLAGDHPVGPTGFTSRAVDHSDEQVTP